jgi:DNA-binding NarL/FixJ family response regulator
MIAPVNAGEYMSADATEKEARIAAAAARAPSPDLVARLTPREAQIVGLIDKGLSNKQIAGRLSIEPATVKNHVHNILEKLDVTRRGEAAAALRHGEASHSRAQTV